MNKFFIPFLMGLLLSGYSQAQQVDMGPDSTFRPTLAQVDSISKTLPVVFSNKGCGRCTTAKNLLTTNQIPFVVVDLGIPENRSLMYSIAQRAAGSSLKGIHYPVVVYKTETQYGQSDLNEFLTTIAKAYQTEAAEQAEPAKKTE